MGKNESFLDTLRAQLFVAGPEAPVTQAENKGTCRGGAMGPEKAVLTRYFASTGRNVKVTRR